MTRKEMITRCVENQIERGITKEGDKSYLIKQYLTGSFRMSYSRCVDWYNSTFNINLREATIPSNERN